MGEREHGWCKSDGVIWDDENDPGVGMIVVTYVPKRPDDRPVYIGHHSDAAPGIKRPGDEVVPSPKSGTPIVVCLCGSTRFRHAWTRAHRERSLAGEIVLSVGVMIQAREEPIRDDGPEKERLDELHLRKIDLADYVLVLCPGGYIGDSTRREIAYAESLGKRIEYDYTPEPAPDGNV